MANENTLPLPGIEHAMHTFRVWLDKNRPWRNLPGAESDVYKAIEKMAAHAAWCFRSHVCPTQTKIDELTLALHRFTKNLATHPDDYCGPCNCEECLSDAL